MAKRRPSELAELLKLLRRIILLSVAAIALAREMPYDILVMRLTVLWAVLYVASGFTEVLFQYWTHRARQSFEAESAIIQQGTQAGVHTGAATD